MYILVCMYFVIHEPMFTRDLHNSTMSTPPMNTAPHTYTMNTAPHTSTINTTPQTSTMITTPHTSTSISLHPYIHHDHYTPYIHHKHYTHTYTTNTAPHTSTMITTPHTSTMITTPHTSTMITTPHTSTWAPPLVYHSAIPYILAKNIWIGHCDRVSGHMRPLRLYHLNSHVKVTNLIPRDLVLWSLINLINVWKTSVYMYYK